MEEWRVWANTWLQERVCVCVCMEEFGEGGEGGEERRGVRKVLVDQTKTGKYSEAVLLSRVNIDSGGHSGARVHARCPDPL